MHQDFHPCTPRSSRIKSGMISILILSHIDNNARFRYMFTPDRIHGQYFQIALSYKQQLLDCISHLNLSLFKHERNPRSEKECLCSFVRLIESVISQIEERLHYDSQKIRFLRDSVHDVPWSNFPLSLTPTIQLIFYSFVNTLEPSLVVDHQHIRNVPITYYARTLPSFMVNLHDYWQVSPYSMLDGASRYENNMQIDTHKNLHPNDPRHVRKSNYERQQNRG